MNPRLNHLLSLFSLSLSLPALDWSADSGAADWTAEAAPAAAPAADQW